AERVTRSERDRAARAADLLGARRRGRDDTHGRDGAHALRAPGARDLTRGADLRAQHANGERDTREAELPLPEAALAVRARLLGAHRRSAEPREDDFRVRPPLDGRALDGGGRGRVTRTRARAGAPMSHEDFTGANGPSLGSDPFTQGDGTLPYLIRMRERS